MNETRQEMIDRVNKFWREYDPDEIKDKARFERKKARAEKNRRNGFFRIS